MKTSKARDLFLDHAVNLLPSIGTVVPTSMEDRPWVYRFGTARYGVRLERVLAPAYLMDLLDRVCAWREAKIKRNQDQVEQFVSRYKLKDKLLLGPGRSPDFHDIVTIEKYGRPSPGAEHYLYEGCAKAPENVEEMSKYVVLSREEVAKVRFLLCSVDQIMKSQVFVATLKNLINSILYAEVIERYPELDKSPKGYCEPNCNTFVHVKVAGKEYMIANTYGTLGSAHTPCLSLVGSGSSGWLRQIDLDKEESLFIKKNKPLARVLKYLSNTKKNRRL